MGKFIKTMFMFFGVVVAAHIAIWIIKEYIGLTITSGDMALSIACLAYAKIILQKE